MALIARAKGRREGQPQSGYSRLFGVDALGILLSRIQGAVISSGTELENLLWQRVSQIADLDEFLDESNISAQHSTVCWVARKEQIKKSSKITSKFEPDLLGFVVPRRVCYVIEVKDGDTFDTKKSEGEHETLQRFANDIAKLVAFKVETYICCFNARTKQEIFVGLKRKFAIEEILTGRELCQLLQVEFDDIVNARTKDQQANLEFVASGLLEIPELKAMILARLTERSE